MCPGWNYSLLEKESKIAQEREKYLKWASVCKQKMQECSIKLINAYIDLFENCLKQHSNLTVLHDYGMLAYLNNNFDKSIELLSKLMQVAETTERTEKLDDQFYHNLGSVCVEAMSYDHAVKYLTEAIKKNPENKETYFYRALAYFETGQFDLAIEDFLKSDNGSTISKSLKEASIDFTQALIAGAGKGALESAENFFPSLCNSAYGVGHVLWTTFEHPIESTQIFANACYEISECVIDYCQDIDWNTIEGYVDEIKILYENFYQLSDIEKGELIGSAIGKYGVDIFAGMGLVKGLSAFKNLKNASRICNLEALIVSNANKEAIIASSLKHASNRKDFFKNVKFEYDKQNKHIIGKHNYQHGKSIFEHPDPERLIKGFAGKGIPMGKEIPGNPNYKELVDFREHIGIWKDQEGLFALPTTKGHIHYSKKGAHIIPAHPQSTFGKT